MMASLSPSTPTPGRCGSPDFRSLPSRARIPSQYDPRPHTLKVATHMTTETRRSFNGKLLGSLAAYGLIETLFARDLLGDGVKPVIQKWVLDLHDLAKDVKEQKIKDTDFQAKLEDLYKKVDLAELIALIDLDRLAATA